MPVLRPLDLICLASAKRRDTLVNIRETREFVVNLAGTDLADKVIPTAKYSPPEIDEFIEAKLEEKPSAIIKAPGIAGCYAWMECTFAQPPIRIGLSHSGPCFPMARTRWPQSTKAENRGLTKVHSKTPEWMEKIHKILDEAKQ
jgi:hypothetical protein